MNWLIVVLFSAVTVLWAAVSSIINRVERIERELGIRDDV
jgi:hypothetical protein